MTISYNTEPQCDRTYLLTCAPNKDSNQSAHPRSLNRVSIVRIKKFCILDYPKCAQQRFRLACANAQADLNLCWAHMSEGSSPTLRFILFVSNVIVLAISCLSGTTAKQPTNKRRCPLIYTISASCRSWFLHLKH